MKSCNSKNKLGGKSDLTEKLKHVKCLVCACVCLCVSSCACVCACVSLVPFLCSQQTLSVDQFTVSNQTEPPSPTQSSSESRGQMRLDYSWPSQGCLCAAGIGSLTVLSQTTFKAPPGTHLGNTTQPHPNLQSLSLCFHGVF